MYKHLINCRRTPVRIKGAIEAARKTHSQQCSSFPFGSQRRFFERLYSRLTKVPLGGVLETATNERTEQDDPEYRSTLQKCSFVRTKNSNSVDYWQCSKCRMVPYDYRAPGSIFLSRPPTVGALKKHRQVCQKDGVHWGTIQASLKTLGVKYGGAMSLVNRKSFSGLIQAIVGKETGLLKIYMAKLGKVESLQGPISDRYLWQKLPMEVDFDVVEESFSALRKDLDLPPANLRDCPDFLAFLRLISVNFEVPPLRPLNGNNHESILISAGLVLDEQATEHSRHSNEEGNALDQKSASVLERTTENMKQESVPISPKLTWDQGIDVMDNIESGQFDDA